jgi:hypothetical protein
MYYNMPINSDLIRLWQLRMALLNLGDEPGAAFETEAFLSLRRNLEAEIKMLSQSIEQTVVALKANNGTLKP